MFTSAGQRMGVSFKCGHHQKASGTQLNSCPRLVGALYGLYGKRVSGIARCLVFFGHESRAPGTPLHAKVVELAEVLQNTFHTTRPRTCPTDPSFTACIWYQSPTQGPSPEVCMQGRAGQGS